MKGMLEFKNIDNGVVKDVDVKGRIITGYLSNFDNKDYDDDVIVKGAFKKTISERGSKTFFLNQHEWKQPHGFFKVLVEDSKGLYFESNPLIDTSYSIDTMKLYEAGIIKEHSIGFVTEKSDYDQKEKVRYIKEVKLYEGSNVTMGANPETPFTGFKSLTLKEANDQVSRIVKMLRNGTLTDETFMQLEIALKQLQKHSFELGKNSLAEPSKKDTQPIMEEPKINKEIEIINQFLKNL
jgi:uncharacterized protein